MPPGRSAAIPGEAGNLIPIRSLDRFAEGRWASAADGVHVKQHGRGFGPRRTSEGGLTFASTSPVAGIQSRSECAVKPSHNTRKAQSARYLVIKQLVRKKSQFLEHFSVFWFTASVLPRSGRSYVSAS